MSLGTFRQWMEDGEERRKLRHLIKADIQQSLCSQADFEEWMRSGTTGATTLAGKGQAYTFGDWVADNKKRMEGRELPLCDGEKLWKSDNFSTWLKEYDREDGAASFGKTYGRADERESAQRIPSRQSIGDGSIKESTLTSKPEDAHKIHFYVRPTSGHSSGAPGTSGSYEAGLTSPNVDDEPVLGVEANAAVRGPTAAIREDVDLASCDDAAVVERLRTSEEAPQRSSRRVKPSLDYESYQSFIGPSKIRATPSSLSSTGRPPRYNSRAKAPIVAKDYNAFIHKSREMMKRAPPSPRYTVLTERDADTFPLIEAAFTLLPETPTGHLRPQAELNTLYNQSPEPVDVQAFLDTCSADNWIAKELIDPILDLDDPANGYEPPLEGHPFKAWYIPFIFQIDASPTVLYLRSIVTNSSNLPKQMGPTSVILGQRMFLDSLYFTWKGTKYLEANEDLIDFIEYRNPFTKEVFRIETPDTPMNPSQTAPRHP